MKELIGHICSVDFACRSCDAPIAGSWVVVDAVDMPMVKMRSRWSEPKDAMWLNVALLKTIRAHEREPRPKRPMFRFTRPRPGDLV